MSRKVSLALFALVAPLTWSTAASAQTQPPQFPNMTFFITSTGGPDGANFGGIEGADKHCRGLATSAGAGGKTWRAYLSTQAADGKPAINARDRIGKGPWVNTEGELVATDVEELHSAANKINVEIARSENGRRIPGRLFVVNQHDILTGSSADGRALPPDKDMTCGNWTKNGEGAAMVGHHDRMGLRDDAASKSWNASPFARLRRSGAEEFGRRGPALLLRGELSKRPILRHDSSPCHMVRRLLRKRPDARSGRLHRSTTPRPEPFHSTVCCRKSPATAWVCDCGTDSP